MTRSRLDLSEFDDTPPNKDPAKLREISDGWRRWTAHPDAWYAVLHGEILCRT